MLERFAKFFEGLGVLLHLGAAGARLQIDLLAQCGEMPNQRCQIDALGIVGAHRRFR